MGVFDKFLDIMRLNDSDYEDDDFYEDEFYEDEYDDFNAKPKRSLFTKRDRAEGDFDEVAPTANRPVPAGSRDINSGTASNKVTPMRPRKAGGNMEVSVVKPSSVDDSREISESLLSGRTVILNLEGMDLEMAQRIIDFVSGATFALGGNLQRISSYIFLVTPSNVDISGDLQDLLGTSMESGSVTNRY